MTTTARPRLTTVILNTNRREDTLGCLASLCQVTYPNHSVIVLDNRSTDGSAEAIRESFPHVRLITLERNLGYAGNNNVGIDAALADGTDWVFVLNEDTVVDPECLDRLAELAEKDPQVGVVGPMVYHHDEPWVIQSAGGVLDARWHSLHLGQNEKDAGQFSEPRQVDWISGCAIMVRRAAIEQVGPLDTRFFYYWEETEWCIRIARGGWKVVHVPSAKVWHKGVQRRYEPKASVTYYATRNWLLTLSKHGAPARVQAAAHVEIFRTLASWTLRPRWRAKRAHRDAMWRGLRDYHRRWWGAMPAAEGSSCA